MLKLYAVPISLYCAKLRIVLRHKNLEWEELLPPGGYGSDEYKSLVPAGNLPALLHDDLLLGDSEAIAEYLNEVFSKPEMLPGDAVRRAKLRERSRFHDTRLEPAVRALFPHIGKAKQDHQLIADQWLVLREKLSQLEQLLPSKLSVLTLGDCGPAITLTWIAELAAHFDLPPILDKKMEMYLDKISQFDAVSTELAEYHPRLTNWLSKQ